MCFYKNKFFSVFYLKKLILQHCDLFVGPAIRKLEKNDLQNGFLSTLDSLVSNTSSCDPETAVRIFDIINANKFGSTFVAENDSKKNYWYFHSPT